MGRPTVQDLLNLKGVRQLTEVLVRTEEEATACEEAGIDLLITVAGEQARKIRAAAPNTFLTMGILYGDCASPTEAVRAGFAALKDGADAVYACMSIPFIVAMAQEGIPVVGHVGLVPQKRTWTGGFRAVGKTTAEALSVYEATLAHQEAGAFAVEMEVVPEQVAEAISKRMEMLVISMGSGKGCDAQYLFAEDILGTNRGHVPRHAKVYRNLAGELDRIQQERVQAFREYQADVLKGTFPDAKNTVGVKSEEYDEFLRKLPPI